MYLNNSRSQSLVDPVKSVISYFYFLSARAAGALVVLKSVQAQLFWIGLRRLHRGLHGPLGTHGVQVGLVGF